MRRHGMGCAILAVLLLAALLLPGCAPAPAASESAAVDESAIVTAVRRGLKGHSVCIRIRFSSDRDMLSELPALADSWVEEALAETEDPAEGDYIRYQYGGYSLNAGYEVTEGRYEYRLELTPQYYLYLTEEAEVGPEVDRLFAEVFAFDDGTSDYEKVRAIYDYLCATVRYDEVHRKNPHYGLRSTAYAALIRKTATCQGYAVALYRLLRTAGLDARVITGTGYTEAGPEYHAWNIVAVDGAYYYLDATWGAGQAEYRYFLKGRDTLEHHVPDPAFTSSDFLARYPVSTVDYPLEKRA